MQSDCVCSDRWLAEGLVNPNRENLSPSGRMPAVCNDVAAQMRRTADACSVSQRATSSGGTGSRRSR